MSAHKFSKMYEAYDGQVVFHMIPYRTVGVDVVVDALAGVGEVRDVQALFALCDTLTASVDFALRDDAPTALRAFEAYWQERPSDIQARWALFTQLVDADVLNVWWNAYKETRDNAGRVDAPEA